MINTALFLAFFLSTSTKAGKYIEGPFSTPFLTLLLQMNRRCDGCVTYLYESNGEVGPLQLFQLTSLQSGQEGFVIIRQLTAVDWLSSFFTDKPNLQL